MSFSRLVIVWVLLISYISCGGASVIPMKPKFQVSITENGTTYVEEVEIDERKQLEYFHVPAHNEVTEADYLYDFVNNLAVRRVKSQAKCFLEPLPKDLPKPTDLKRALQMAGQTPSSENSFVARNYWSVSGQVDKNLLRQEVQDFCGQFPVFRLRNVHLEAFGGLVKRSLGRARAVRNAVDADLVGIPFCAKASKPTRGPDGKFGCHAHEFLYTLEVRESHCTWFLTCQFNKGRKKITCDNWKHEYNSMVCYSNVHCPPKV